MGRLGHTAAIIVALCVLPLVSAVAQRSQSDRESIDSLLSNLRIHLDRQDRELADEYLDIVAQIRDMIDDYSTELKNLKDVTNDKHNASLKHLQKGLHDGTYADDPQQLMDDIDDLIQDLKAIENEQKAIHNTNRPQSTRIIRNLRRQLVMQVDLIEDYTSSPVKAVFNQEDMRRYLEAAMVGIKAAIAAIPDSIHLHSLDSLARDLGGLHVNGLVPPIPPAPVTAPGAIVFPHGRIGWTKKSDESGSIRSIVDSLTADKNKTVKIENPSGGINLEGWDEDYIRAQLGVEVASSSRSRESDFLEQVTLKLNEQPGGYEVVANFPSISDPDTRVLQSQLIVKVPTNLPVECSNSFGVVVVANLDKGLKLESQNSEVTVDNIDGGANIVNSMGTITISEVDGPLRVRNGYSSIVIYGCDGDMDINNAYALVKLTDTRGHVAIHNSGQTQIRNHEGAVTIANTYGTVQLHDIDGSVTVSNAYSPIAASSISGSFEAENAYSSISASDVQGPLSANNNYGQILIMRSVGPMDLRSENGNVDLALYGDLAGSSRVMASHGAIRLSLADPSNLRITARTTNGEIKSTGSMKVSQQGSVATAELLYGSGSTQLSLSGTNTRILIDEK